jgi:hypothetical protein
MDILPYMYPHILYLQWWMYRGAGGLILPYIYMDILPYMYPHILYLQWIYRGLGGLQPPLMA